MRLLFTCLLLFGLMSSCSSDEEGYNEMNIDAPLIPYFESFKEEASLRGMEVDFEALGVSGYLATINTPGVIGQCDPDNTSIVFDRFFWLDFDDYGREMVVYHELGHCILKRAHCDKINSDRTCFSIMHSSEDLCDNNYNELTRDDLIDELFDLDHLLNCR